MPVAWSSRRRRALIFCLAGVLTVALAACGSHLDPDEVANDTGANGSGVSAENQEPPSLDGEQRTEEMAGNKERKRDEASQCLSRRANEDEQTRTSNSIANK